MTQPPMNNRPLLDVKGLKKHFNRKQRKPK